MRWSDRVGRRLKLRGLHIVLAVAESGSMAKAVVAGAQNEVGRAKVTSPISSTSVGFCRRLTAFPDR